MRITLKKLAATSAAGVLAFSLVACSSDEGSEGSEGGDGGDGGEGAEASSEVDVAEDLETARQAVLEALEQDDWAQVMLASDVEEPTVKYGLLVMPFVKSDAAARVTGTVEISNGTDFVIEAESAATGQVWQIDQDGNISEVTG
ncbi:MAG: hypothetical protein ACK5H2_01115 [Beutenbergiaceae bacterium]